MVETVLMDEAMLQMIETVLRMVNTVLCWGYTKHYATDATCSNVALLLQNNRYYVKSWEELHWTADATFWMLLHWVRSECYSGSSIF